MSGEPKDWEKITPKHLLPAVEHIRTSFETSAWRCSEITKNLGFAALHPQTADLAALVDYIAALDNYQRIVGSAPQRQFERLLSFRTPPAVFRAYCDLYQLYLEAHIRERFDSTLKVALANLHDLNQHPVDWAKAQLELLVNGHLRSVERWIKEVCDTQETPEPELIDEEAFKEAMFWKKWRAPIRDNNILARFIKPAARNLGLPWVNWRSLRTSHAVWLKMVGADVKDAQGQMRHSRASTTLDIYQQFVPESQQRAVERLNTLGRIN